MRAQACADTWRIQLSCSAQVVTKPSTQNSECPQVSLPPRLAQLCGSYPGVTITSSTAPLPAPTQLIARPHFTTSMRSPAYSACTRGVSALLAITGSQPRPGDEPPHCATISMVSRRSGHRRRPREVRSSLGTVVFLGRVNSACHRDFMTVLSDSKPLQTGSLTLDFRSITNAYADGMVPIICGIERLRQSGATIDIFLPDDPEMARLFRNTNWAHFLAPDKYEVVETAHHRHLSVRLFRTFQEQQLVVNAFLDVVMRSMRLNRDVLDGLEWSINEITDNVLNHAECPTGGFVQVTTSQDHGLVRFTVADPGRGILQAMREGFPDLPDDRAAIGEAVKAGVTSNPSKGQGNGLAGTMRIATLSGGKFAITSGTAQFLVAPLDSGPESRSYSRPPTQRFDGTIVDAIIGSRTSFHLSEALQARVVDVIELRYETDSSDALRLRLKDETTGYGTRHAGRQLRTKCLNLLAAEPGKPLLVDWDGIPVISSSFADEFVGKLFVELGPLAFSARVRNTGTEALVRGLVDKAIMQRVSQTVAGSGYAATEEAEDEAELPRDTAQVRSSSRRRE